MKRLTTLILLLVFTNIAFFSSCSKKEYVKDKFFDCSNENYMQDTDIEELLNIAIRRAVEKERIFKTII